MENVMTITTTDGSMPQTPSRLGMPTWAAFPIATDLTAGYEACTEVVGIDGIERDRVSKGHLGLAQAFVPGSHAWSPPSS